jgi:hypothetical protein
LGRLDMKPTLLWTNVSGIACRGHGLWGAHHAYVTLTMLDVHAGSHTLRETQYVQMQQGALSLLWQGPHSQRSRTWTVVQRGSDSQGPGPVCRELRRLQFLYEEHSHGKGGRGDYCAGREGVRSSHVYRLKHQYH